MPYFLTELLLSRHFLCLMGCWLNSQPPRSTGPHRCPHNAHWKWCKEIDTPQTLFLVHVNSQGWMEDLTACEKTKTAPSLGLMMKLVGLPSSLRHSLLVPHCPVGVWHTHCQNGDLSSDSHSPCPGWELLIVSKGRVT